MKRNNQKQGGPAPKRQKTQTAMVLAQPNKAIVAPRAQSSIMRNQFRVTEGSKRGSLRCRGQDWLGRVPVPAGAVPGQTLLEVYLNPLELTGTRLSLFAQMYDKYRFLETDFEFVPCASTTARGSLILAYDRDISDATPPASDLGIRQFMAMQDAVAGPIWGPLVCKCPLSHPEEGLFTNPVAGGDDRLSYQGQFYVALMEVPAEPNSVGDVYIHYDIEFYDPQLDTQSPQAYGSAEAGQANFGPSAGDAFRSFVPNNTTALLQGVLEMLPKIDPVTGRAFLDLAQGVYRLVHTTSSGSTTAATAVSYQSPTVVANVPKPAPAPQAAIVNEWKADASNAGGILVSSPEASLTSTITVPPGGAKVFLTYDDLTGWTGSAGTAYQKLHLDQLSKYWAPAASLV